MLADYLASVQAKTFAKMSGIELADIQIPGEKDLHARARENVSLKL